MKSIKKYVQKFNALSTHSVKSILDIGSLMIDVKTELNESDYKVFLSQIKYSDKSSSIRKWEKIGSSRVRLEPIAKLLPPNWSTIYKLSALDPNTLDVLVKSNVLNSSVTAKEIDAELNPALTKKKLVRYALNIAFLDTLSVEDYQSLVEHLKLHHLYTEIVLMPNKDLDAHINESTTAQLAA